MCMAYSQKGIENKNTIIASLWFKLWKYIRGAFMRFTALSQAGKALCESLHEYPYRFVLICKNKMLN